MSAPRPAMVCVFALLLTVTCPAGIRGPGRYSGVVVFDRWGGCTLCRSWFITYISEAAKEPLTKHSGELVTLDATDVFQPINPGEALIRKFTLIAPERGAKQEPSPRASVRLSVRPDFKDGQAPVFTIVAQNMGEAPALLKYDSLSPVVLTKKRGGPNYFEPADGPSRAVMTSEVFWSLGDDVPRLHGAGTRWNVSYKWAVTNVVTLPREVVLGPKEKTLLSLSVSLPAGEYEFFAGYYDHQRPEECVASNLVGFDIGADDRATLPKVPGR